MTLLSGILLVRKPVGPTSHDVVSRIRKAAGIRRVGHAGTLDPFASGLLILLLGQATRLSEYLLALDKRYDATARLGIETSTHDSEGEIVTENRGWASVSRADVEKALTGFEGPILQAPPRFSAKKVRGEAAHRRVRRGEEVALEPAEVIIHSTSLLEFSGPEVRFRVRCSSGTYVRALARDLGRAPGVGAHLTGLVRTGIGSFDLGTAADLVDLRDRAAVEDRLVPPAVALSHLPSVEITAADAEKIRRGQFVPISGTRPPEGGTVLILLAGTLLAVGTVRGGELRPRKVLSDG
ncbi:MAG: tRNA pseudouridine(55) synthase TruB [Longimicrobiales bacterium]